MERLEQYCLEHGWTLSTGKRIGDDFEYPLLVATLTKGKDDKLAEAVVPLEIGSAVDNLIGLMKNLEEKHRRKKDCSQVEFDFMAKSDSLF